MLNVVVLVSGGGTNLQAIIDAVDSGEITNTKIAGVISNNKNAYALERAEKHGIPNQCISPKDYESREIFNQEFMKAVDVMQPDLIVLDPPRDGIHPKAIGKILNFGVSHMVYVSCKPTSLARDLEPIQAAGYQVDKVCCVDMFPHTANCETVGSLTRKK